MKYNITNKIKNQIIILIFLVVSNSIFSQNSEIIATGTVYVTSSVSNGAIGYPSTSQGPHLFKNQNIYFTKDSIKVKTRTDSMGVFSIALKAGEYTIYQEGAQNNASRGLQHFGTYVIDVKKDCGPFKVEFHNSSNRRSAINTGAKGIGMPGATPKNNNQNIPQKK